MRHSLNKLIMQAWSKTKLNMDLWKWHMNLIKARASKWAELNHWPDSCICFDFTAETSKASTLWGLPDSTVPPPPTDYKAASCLFVSNYRKHCCALFGKVQAITSPTVVKSPGLWVWDAQDQFAGLKAEGAHPNQAQQVLPRSALPPSASYPASHLCLNGRDQTHTSPHPLQQRCSFIFCPDYQLNAPQPEKNQACKRVGVPGLKQR